MYMPQRLIALLMFWLLRNVSSAASTRSRLAFVRQKRARSTVTRVKDNVEGRQQDPLTHYPRTNPALYHTLSRATRSSMSLIRRFSTQNDFFAQDTDFATMGVQSPALLRRLSQMGLERPTAVQHAAYTQIRESQSDVTIGAETGSGKVSKML